MTEEKALGRVLLISKQAYAAFAMRGGEDTPDPALLDSLSAALSHCENEQAPLGGLMRQLKREVKASGKPFYREAKRYFSRFYPLMEYDFDKAKRHIPAMIYGNDRILEKLAAGEADKARSMSDAMKSYPGFLFGEFEALSDEQFYDLVFGYYPKLYDEPFMDEMKELFAAK